MDLENLLAIILFFGAAIIATIIILIDVVKNRNKYKRSLKWLAVILLSIWQVGCWRLMNRFDSAFGNSSDMAIYEIIFIVIVFSWLIHHAAKYIMFKGTNENSEKL